MINIVKTKGKVHARKLITQKIIGLAIIVLSVLICYLASTGLFFEDKDATAVFLTAPMGLGLLFTNKTVIE